MSHRIIIIYFNIVEVMTSFRLGLVKFLHDADRFRFRGPTTFFSDF